MNSSFSLSRSFIPSKGYVITPLLIYLNIIIFLVMEMGHISFLHPSDRGWLFLSNTFVHISFVHLLVNMYGFYIIGRELEQLIGAIRLVGIYFFSAWLAAFNSILWGDLALNSGTGGAIFGLYGCYIGLLIAKQANDTNKESVLRTMIILVGYNLAIGFMGNFDTAANVGGLLYGALIGVLGGAILVEQKKTTCKSAL
jgi:rhomboid protease GluP